MTLAEDFEFDAKAKEAADKYLSVARNLSERNFGPLLCFTTTNLFLWHIDALNAREMLTVLLLSSLTKPVIYSKLQKLRHYIKSNF